MFKTVNVWVQQRANGKSWAQKYRSQEVSPEGDIIKSLTSEFPTTGDFPSLQKLPLMIFPQRTVSASWIKSAEKVKVLVPALNNLTTWMESQLLKREEDM